MNEELNTTESSSKFAGSPRRLLRAGAWIIGGLIAIPLVGLLIAPMFPYLGMTIAGLMAIAGGLQFYRRRFMAGLGLLLAGFMMSAFAKEGLPSVREARLLAAQQQAETARLTALKQSDPDAWLAALKASGQDAAWMEGLQQLRPSAWQAETARRAADAKSRQEKAAADAKRIAAVNAEIEAQRAAERAAVSAEQLRLSAEDYMKRLQRERRYMQSSYAEGIGQSPAADAAILQHIPRWAALVEERPSQRLTPAQTAEVAAFKAEAARQQRLIFPKLRASFARQLGKQMWINDVEVAAAGGRHERLNLTGGQFAANAEIDSVHRALMPAVLYLRFRRVNYEWYRGSDSSYYTLKTPEDAVVGSWQGERFIPIP